MPVLDMDTYAGGLHAAQSWRVGRGDVVAARPWRGRPRNTSSALSTSTSSFHPRWPPVSPLTSSSPGDRREFPDRRTRRCATPPRRGRPARGSAAPSTPEQRSGLGEYHKQFAGVLVWVEHRPRTDDTSKISKTDKMLEEISSTVTERLDSRGYLTARLMDLYVGDWDRGPPQWFWERTGQKHDHLWRAIPHDRDWVFGNHDGILYYFVRQTSPWFVEYNPHYPDLVGLEATAWGLDRRLLQDLEYPVWDSTAHWLKSALTDSVIADAVAQLPPPERARYGGQLVAALRARRDALPQAARSFYGTVARQADVHTVAVPSIIEIKRWRDTMEIRARTRDGEAVTYYERRFDARATGEVRLYLAGGPDSIAVSGGGDHIMLRLIAEADGDVLVAHEEAGAGASHVYDAGHPMRIVAGDIPTNRSPYKEPTLPAGTPDAARDPVAFLLRDAPGQRCLPASVFTISSVAGVTVETGTDCERYGFRRIPWAVDNTVTAGYTFGPGGVIGTYIGAIRAIGGSPVWSLQLDGTSAEYVWFFGIGNATSDPLPSNDYRARRARFFAAPMVSLLPAPHLTVSISPEMRYWDTEQTPQYFDLTLPYGSGPFGVVDGKVSAVFDTRHDAYSDSSGVRLELSGRGVPSVWSATSAYGTVHAEAAGFVTISPLPLDPVIAMRVGGDKVWGSPPFQDLPTVGGSTTVRGYYDGRFSGDAAGLPANAASLLKLAQR